MLSATDAARRGGVEDGRRRLTAYGQRYHHSEAIATGEVEPTGHPVVSRRCWNTHQMPCSAPGAQAVLQTRGKPLDGEVGASVKRWYPNMDTAVKERSAAASPASRCWPGPLVMWEPPAATNWLIEACLAGMPRARREPEGDGWLCHGAVCCPHQWL